VIRIQSGKFSLHYYSSSYLPLTGERSILREAMSGELLNRQEVGRERTIPGREERRLGNQCQIHFKTAFLVRQRAREGGREREEMDKR